MKTKKIILLTFISSLALMMSCSQYEYWDLPKDADGKAIITQVSTTTSTGISALEGAFTINSHLPNAKPGDVMTVELLNFQVPSWGGSEQLLPIAGTAKQATVDADRRISVAFTRAEAQLVNVGDVVTVTIAGATESGLVRVTLTSAMALAGPHLGGTGVTLVRSDEEAFFRVQVTPRNTTYTGAVVAQRRSGAGGDWIDIGTFAAPQPYQIPVTGNDFVDSDVMHYRFTATAGANSEVIETAVTISPSSFLAHRTGSLMAGDGLNLLKNAKVAANNVNAIVTMNAEYHLEAGAEWAVGDNEISFVPATSALYNANDFDDVIAAYEDGTAVAAADLLDGAGVYIFKIVQGADPADTVYGMIRPTSVVPGHSVSYQYRIGNMYAHIAIL